MKKPINIRLTPDGYQKLLDEQKELTERRPGVLKRMVDAREQGDLSENAGYHAAKEELGKIDSRQKELKLLIRFADVIKSSDQSSVSFGNTVGVESDGVEQTFIIVSAQEADPLQGKISDVSPIGKSLMGKRVGDEVEIITPAGSVVFKIKSIKV